MCTEKSRVSLSSLNDVDNSSGEGLPLTSHAWRHI